jgi:hypothetical protein
MTATDLYAEIIETKRLMRLALTESGQRGLTYAEAERAYRIALAQQILIERSNGTPTTVINDVSRGNPAVAELKFTRDCAEVKYKAAMEAINIYKKELTSLEEQLSREWGQCR